jgi:hypothetical protein
MTFEIAHSFLVHPGKNLSDQPEIAGTEIELKGKLFDMLAEVYVKSEEECNIDIAFVPNTDGEQQNDTRDLLLAYLASPIEINGQKIAQLLQAVTTKRSSLGLFFLMKGSHRGKTRLVIARFPANSGILVDHQSGSLNVEFIEKVFMKSATSYKSAVYTGSSLNADFWDGSAVDKQTNNNDVALSDYWIKDFLRSDFKTTAAAGTRRLANALRKVANETPDLEIKQEIAAAASLAGGMKGRTSIADFISQHSLSDPAKDAVRDSLRSERLFTETFEFDRAEFKKHLTYKSLELDNGAMLVAQTDEFDSLFKHEEIPEGRSRYIIEGRVVGQKLRTTK